MLDVANISDDHELTPKLHSGRLVLDFVCLHHEKCELVRMIEENEAANVKWSHIPDIIEWYNGPETLLQAGKVHLEFLDNYVSWHYLETPRSSDDLIDDLYTENAPSYAITLKIGIQNSEGSITGEYSLSVHETDANPEQTEEGVLTKVDYLNEIFSDQLLAAAPDSDFRNDYITVDITFTRDYFGEYDEEVIWDYIADATD